MAATWADDGQCSGTTGKGGSMVHVMECIPFRRHYKGYRAQCDRPGRPSRRPRRLLDVLAEPLEPCEQRDGRHRLRGKAETEGGIPSNKPSPARALLGWQYQDRSRIRWRPSRSVTSVGDMAGGVANADASVRS